MDIYCFVLHTASWYDYNHSYRNCGGIHHAKYTFVELLYMGGWVKYTQISGLCVQLATFILIAYITI